MIGRPPATCTSLDRAASRSSLAYSSQTASCEHESRVRRPLSSRTRSRHGSSGSISSGVKSPFGKIARESVHHDSSGVSVAPTGLPLAIVGKILSGVLDKRPVQARCRSTAWAVRVVSGGGASRLEPAHKVRPIRWGRLSLAAVAGVGRTCRDEVGMPSPGKGGLSTVHVTIDDVMSFGTVGRSGERTGRRRGSSSARIGSLDKVVHAIGGLTDHGDQGHRYRAHGPQR
jgi:hypothetical protein